MLAHARVGESHRLLLGRIGLGLGPDLVGTLTITGPWLSPLADLQAG